MVTKLTFEQAIYFLYFKQFHQLMKLFSRKTLEQFKIENLIKNFNNQFKFFKDGELGILYVHY